MGKKSRMFYWIILLVGVTIGLIALLCPTASIEGYSLYGHITESLSIWMIGYSRYYWWETGFQIIWTTNPDIMIVNLVSFISIVIILIITLILSLVKRKKRSSYFFLFSGISLIGLGIYYIIGMDMQIIGFWDMMNEGFGIIGIFFSAILIIIGFGVGFTDFEKIRIPMPSILEEKPQFEKGGVIPEKVHTESITSFKFCPECGTKLVSLNQRFCVTCGIDISKISEL